MLQVDVEMATAFEDKNTCLPISENGISETEKHQMPCDAIDAASSSMSMDCSHYLKTVMTPNEFVETIDLKNKVMPHELDNRENTRIDSQQKQDVIQQQTFPVDHSITKNGTMNHILRKSSACSPKLIRSQVPPPIDTVNITVPIPIMDAPCKKLKSMEQSYNPQLGGCENAEVDHIWSANLRRELNAFLPSIPQVPHNTPLTPTANFEDFFANNSMQVPSNSNHTTEEMHIIAAHYGTTLVGITRVLSMVDQTKQDSVSYDLLKASISNELQQAITQVKSLYDTCCFYMERAAQETMLIPKCHDHIYSLYHFLEMIISALPKTIQAPILPQLEFYKFVYRSVFFKSTKDYEQEQKTKYDSLKVSFDKLSSSMDGIKSASSIDNDLSTSASSILPAKKRKRSHSSPQQPLSNA
jgi:hypothetical protein